MLMIGLLGGMSWVSTAHYYERLNQMAADAYGPTHCAPLMIWQTDFARIVRLQEQGDWDGAGALLGTGAEALAASGAGVLAICTNTMHLVSESVASAGQPAQLVHIVEVVAQHAKRAGITRLGLLGTAYTMESVDLYPPTLESFGIETAIPSPEHRQAIQAHTFDELIQGEVTDVCRQTFADAIRALIADGADGIVLACTEHALAVAPSDWDVPIIDSTQAHIEAIFDAAVASQP